MTDIAWDFFNKETTINLFHEEIDFIIKHLSKIPRNIAVAVSGGSDSMSLLILMKYWSERTGISLICITIDHKLRKESADEALFVKNFCKKNNIEHVTLEWIRNYEKINSGKIENLARDARYNLISKFCSQKSIEVVATGHTWNDQLETFEMRKEAKSSEFGLAGISKIRSISKDVKLIRPIMNFTRKHLQDFLINEKVSWKNDPMNEDVNFKRVFHRKNIELTDKEKLLQKTAKIKLFGKQRREIEHQSVHFLKENLNPIQTKFGYTIFNTKKFLAEKNDIQIEILKRTIWNIGGKKYASKIDNDILQKIFGKKINTIGRCFIKANKKYTAIFRENRNLDETIAVNSNGSYIFDNRFLISVNDYEFHDELMKYMILSRKKLGIIFGDNFENNPDIPHEALYSLPCLCMKKNNNNTEPVFIYGDNIVFYGYRTFETEKVRLKNNVFIKCEFIPKVNLFDVFL